MKPRFASNPVVAHRGAFKKNGFPENSIASLKEAIRLQCTGAEFDIWMTADDSLVINHDPTYNKLDIEKSTYKQLAIVPLSNGETLPTLQQYLLAGLSGNTQTRLVLEIKPSRVSKERGQVVAEKAVAMVKQLHAEQMAVYISFDYDILKKIRALDNKAITQYLEGNKSPEELKADGIDGADYNLAVFKQNPGWVDSAKKLNIILNVWTVNSRADLEFFLQHKFDFITTNEPELLLDMVRETKK